jgi:hypothetical protein
VPRYFFHVRDGAVFIDVEGTVLAGPLEARAQAIRASGAMLADLGVAFWRGTEWRMIVMAESGATICSLCFSARGDAVAE